MSRKAKERRGNLDIAYRLSNLIDRCLDTISRHVDESDLLPPNGRFAYQFFMISSSIAGLYLSLGKLQSAKKLFSAAIDYLRTTQIEETSDPRHAGLLRDFASCCARTGDLISSQQALKSALAMMEQAFGEMSDEAVEVASRLRAIEETIATEVYNHKRALVASTGEKLSQVERDDSGPSNHRAAPFPAPVSKVDEVSTVPQTEAVSENNMKCQLWFSKPFAIPGPYQDLVLQGGIYLQVFKAVQITDATVTLRCISTTKRPWGDGLAEVISSGRKQLRLRKATNFDLNTTLKSTRKTLTGVKSLLSKAWDDLPYLNYLAEGPYTASFEFILLHWKQKASVQTEHMSIRWEVQVTFQKPRLFADPLLQLRHEILVIQGGPFLDFGTRTIRGEIANRSFILEVSRFIITFGGLIRIVATLSFSALGTSARCVLVQTVTHLSQTGLRRELSQRRVSLSPHDQLIQLEDDVWIPMAMATQPGPAAVEFRLPTCRQMREAHEKQLNASCHNAPFRVEHHLEVSPMNSEELRGTKVLMLCSL